MSIGVLDKDGAPQTINTIDDLIAYLTATPLATQTTLAAVLAKLSADPATQTTSAAILAKLIAAPATEAKQDTLIAKDFATQTTLAAASAKLPASLGSKADAASLAVTQSTEDKAVLNAIKTAAERAITGSASGIVAPTTSAATLVSSRTGRIGLILANKGAVPVHIGIATVTTAQYRLDPGESMVWYSEQLVQGITASGTGAIHYVEFY